MLYCFKICHGFSLCPQLNFGQNSKSERSNRRKRNHKDPYLKVNRMEPFKGDCQGDVDRANTKCVQKAINKYHDMPATRKLHHLVYIMVFENHWKVSFNITSEASYVYILSGQKFIKMPKNRQFGEFLKSWSFGQNSVTRPVNFNMTSKRVIFKHYKLTWFNIWSRDFHEIIETHLKTCLA